MRTIPSLFLSLILCSWACSPATQKQPTAEAKQPNVLFILADDMGYGDIAAYTNNPLMNTPNLDRLMQEGTSFMNAHTPSGVCTPTRYSVLTGRYSWRSKLQSGVLFGFDQPLIEEDEFTIGKMFQSKGYRTASIGKWHLGLPWELADDSNYEERTKDKIFFQVLAKEKDVKPNAPFTDQQWHNKRGFDHFYGISASLDIPPYGFVEDAHYVSALDSALQDEKHQIDNKKDFWRGGLSTSGFDPNEVLDTFVDKASAFITKDQDKPFFIYLPFTAPHTPWLPADEFIGKSGAGKYGDFVTMMDAYVGRLEKVLEKTGQLDNTIIIFSSDNGASTAYMQELGGNGHQANGIYRGQKGDLYEGGHRVPLIMKWKGHIPEGQKRNDLVMLNDIVATMGDLVGAEIPSGGAQDSYSFYGALMNNADFQGRTSAVYHSQVGTFGLQSGDYKFIEHLGSGGFTKPRIIKPKKGQVNRQLFNLKEDPAEQNDLAPTSPELVKKMQDELDQIRGWKKAM